MEGFIISNSLYQLLNANTISLNYKIIILFTIAVLCIAGLIIHGPIAQDINYHSFADQRTFFSIPNFMNVISNLPFAVVGLLGMRITRKAKEKPLRHSSFALFQGFLLLTFGSGYYHLFPNNETLVYDRLCMVVIFMSFFAYFIYERIHKINGYRALFLLNIIGIASIISWIITERSGNSDLRWYAMIQFFPLLAIPLILLLFKSSFNPIKEVVIIFICFVLAKFAEAYDKEIFEVLGNTISGHTIKHLLMTAAGFEIIQLFMKRLKILDKQVLPINMKS